MSFIPALNLKGNMQVLEVYGYWEYDDGTNDPYLYYPYQWKVKLTADYQTHSSPYTPTPYSYGVSDIKVGQWLAAGLNLNGFAWKIIEAVDINDTYATVIIEDVDRYNLANDVFQSGGGPSDGDITIFELDEQGHPILTNMPANYFDSTLFPGLLSRFNLHNPKTGFVVVTQPNHGFVIGDMIVMQPDATYMTVAAVTSSKEALGRIIGQVTQIITTGLFAYKPRGEVRDNLTTTLPTDSVPGQLIYLDPANPGKLTATRPTKLATPLYIRLETPSKGIYMGAGSGGGTVDEDELRFATVYRVANMTARDALDLTKLKEGDQAYVTDTGNGEWGLFMVSAKTLTPLAVTWTKLADFDTSTMDGRTVGVSVKYTDVAPKSIYRISPTDRVTVITVEVISAFHPSASMTVGDDADNARLVSDQNIDLSVVDTYTINPSYQYGGTDESMIRAYLTPGSSTGGEAKVTISYI